jgi:hypothetical protein
MYHFNTPSMLGITTYLVFCLAFINHHVYGSTPTFKIGLVKDNFLDYATTDTEIFAGTVYWAHWINSNGGLQYP